jgi:hypothetical protein
VDLENQCLLRNGQLISAVNGENGLQGSGA